MFPSFPISHLRKLNTFIHNKIQTDVCVLDFTKAFDKIEAAAQTQVVWNQMRNEWVDSRLPEWMIPVCHHWRRQIFQSPCPVRSPKGSVTGPCLFLFYIIDIVKGFHSSARLFADDTMIWPWMSSPSCTKNQLAYCISPSTAVYHWFSYSPCTLWDWNLLPESTVQKSSHEAFRSSLWTARHPQGYSYRPCTYALGFTRVLCSCSWGFRTTTLLLTPFAPFTQAHKMQAHTLTMLEPSINWGWHFTQKKEKGDMSL